MRSVAGRLAYTQYSLVTRWLMRRIARKEHAPTDTSRDYELTDWTALEGDTRQFGQDVRDCVCARMRAEHYRSAVSPTV
jgi:menaquinone-dependent protoporphyrinogen oxidase